VTHPQIAVFARLADGNAEAVRKIEGQKTRIGRTIHSIAYDPIHDEFTVPSQLAQAVLTFRGAADGEEAPIRVIQGPLTELRDPDVLTSDPVHNEIFVPEGYAILVFAREANGNAAPIRVLKGPAGQDYRLGMTAVDPVHNVLVVAGSIGEHQPRLLIYNRTDQGNATPKAIIGGPKSGMRSAGGPFVVYPPKGEIILTIPAPGGDTNRFTGESYVGVWSIQDNGDVPPRFTIGGPKGILQRPKGATIDVKNKSIIVSDKGLNAVMTYYFPELF